LPTPLPFDELHFAEGALPDALHDFKLFRPVHEALATEQRADRALELLKQLLFAV